MKMRAILMLLSMLAGKSLPGGDGYKAPATTTNVPFLAIVYALVALAGICVVAFRDAKRTHLD